MKKLFEKNRGKTVLFLGRVPNFTDIELQNFLEEQGMSYTNRYNPSDDIALIVLSSMLTPIEEELSYELYDMGIADISLSQFEEYFVQNIKPNSLIMSLKLSNNQDRLKRFLKNEAFSDEIYLKLFKLYDWNSQGLYDNDDNRDITISFVKRFYKPDGFRDPAMIYAPTTVMNIAQETDTPEVLDAILSMPNHEIKVSRKEQQRPKNLREIVALNEAISTDSIKRLMSFNNPQIDYFLSANSNITPTQQEILFQKNNKDIKLMLSHNQNLSDNIFEKLLDDSEDIIKTLLTFQKIDAKRLDNILSKSFDPKLLSFIGNNQTLKTDIIDKLLELQNIKLDFKLASNRAIKQEHISKLYDRYGNAIAINLCKNINIPKNMATDFYKLALLKNSLKSETSVLKTERLKPSIPNFEKTLLKKDKIIEALATNISTPSWILNELCQRDNRELNRFLASNPSVDIYYLQQFQLDSSLITILANNPTYAKKILNNLGI